MYLGSLGADVVKVESVQRADGFRYSATFPELGDDWYERSLVWQATNLSKKGITLDLTRDEGRDLLWRLLEDADVLVENFSPRVVESFGLSEDVVRERFPGLVYVRMPGFGLVGPWRDHVGWAMVYEQACGLAQVTGFPDGPPLNPGGFADPVVGIHAAVALQAALRHRERTGEGQLIEVAQVEVMASITAEQVITRQATAVTPGRTGNRSDEAVLEGVYPAEDGWVAVSVRDAEDQAALDRAFGPTDEETLAGWIAERTTADAAEAIRAAGLPAAPVLGVPGMLDEPQLAARGYYQPLTHPLVGEIPFPGWPMAFSAGVPEHHRWVTPTLGQDNDEVLGGRLGLGADELATLREQRVIGESLA
jgi:crotonobetainyl-CoA:carnitine CoA-transferase CaiB-like acyl-CoA transferase